MSDYNYYREQLKKLDTNHCVTAKFVSNNGDTNYLSLNKESATEIVQFLTENYLTEKE
jgi:hypothetical protein